MIREQNSPLPAAGDTGRRPAVGRLLARMALVAPVIAITWWFGGVQAAQQWWLFAGLIVSFVLYLATFSRRHSAGSLPLPLVPLSLALILGLTQLVPLPSSILARLGPQNLALWQTLVPSSSISSLGDPAASQLIDQEQRFARDMGVSSNSLDYRLSLNPASTRHDLALLVAAVATFFLASQFFGRSNAMLGLLTVVAAQGAALAFFGLAQQLRWNGLLFGTVELTEGGAPFASFVNRNSGAGYLNMCFAAAVAVTVWAFAHRRVGTADRARSRQQPVFSASHDRLGIWRFLAELNGIKLAALTATVLIFAGIVCSLSRGAWLSAAGAVGVTSVAVLAIHRCRIRVSWLVAAAVIGLALVSWLGRLDTVEQRFATLWKQGRPPDSRWAHWENGLQAAGDFTHLGSGLGTYRYVYKMYEQNGSLSWFFHAENQYLEALVEGGVPGFALLVTTIGLVLIACHRLLLQPMDSGSFACGVGGCLAISSQVIHAGFDFGLYMPANMALLALICGSVCGVAGRAARQRSQGSTSRGLGRRSVPFWASFNWLSLPSSRALPACFGMLLTTMVAVAGVEVFAAAEVERVLRVSRLTYEPDATSLSELDGLIDQLTSAALIQPNNAEVHQRLGQLWIYRYRLEALAELRKYPQGHDLKSLWNWTSTVNLHNKANEFNELEQHKLSQLRQARDVRTNLTNAARALLAARRSCPLLIKPHLLLAEIGMVVSEVADDRPSLERALRLSVGDFDSLVECGLVEAQSARIERAWKAWRRAVEVLPERYDRVLALAAEYANSEHQLAKLVPDQAEQILRIAREYFADAGDAAICEELADRAYCLLEASPLADEGRHAYLCGVSRALVGDHQAAIDWFTKALQKQPEMAAWRFELAQQFDRFGDLEKATQQAAMCRRLDPHNGLYAAFQQELADKQLEAAPPRDRQNRSTDNGTSANVGKTDDYHLVDSRRPTRLEKWVASTPGSNAETGNER